MMSLQFNSIRYADPAFRKLAQVFLESGQAMRLPSRMALQCLTLATAASGLLVQGMAHATSRWAHLGTMSDSQLP
jgi:hypothetical protein